MASVKRLDRWLNSIPIWFYTVLVTVTIIVKSGLSFAALNIDTFQNFPYPPDHWSALSYGMRLLVYGTGQKETLTFGVVGFLLTIVVIVLIAYSGWRSVDAVAGRLIILLAIVSPIGMVLFNRLGQNDVFMILGATVIAFFGPKIIPFLVGLLLMFLGNPEQTIVALVTVLVLSFIPELRAWRRLAIAGILVGISAFIVLSVFARSVGSRTRIEYLPDYLSNSFYAFAANLPLSFYAFFGAFWLVLAGIILHFSRNSRIFLISGLIVIPIFVTMITVDQTRVFVGVTTLSVFILLKTYVPELKKYFDARGFEPLLGATFLVVVFLPIIDIWGTSGHARTPYLWFFQYVVPQVKIWILGY